MQIKYSSHWISSTDINIVSRSIPASATDRFTASVNICRLSMFLTLVHILNNCSNDVISFWPRRHFMTTENWVNFGSSNGLLPNHYLKQNWLNINKALWHLPEGTFTEAALDSIHYKVRESYVYENSATHSGVNGSSQLQHKFYVKTVLSLANCLQDSSQHHTGDIYNNSWW